MIHTRMAGLEGKGIPSVEQTLVQLAQEWDAEEGNAGYEHQAKRQRTHSDLGLQAGLGIPVSDATSPGTIWSDLDTDMPLDDKHGIPGFHLPQAASEPEQDAQAGMNGVSSVSHETSTVVSEGTAPDEQHPTERGVTNDLQPQPYGWAPPIAVSGSPLMLERLSPFLVTAGSGYATTDHEPHPNAASPPHHPYSWGDTPMHTSAVDFDNAHLPEHTRSLSEGSHDPMNVPSHMPEPAGALRRQASNQGSVKGRTLWEEKHGLSSPWNLTDDYLMDDAYPTQYPARNEPSGWSASSSMVDLPSNVKAGDPTDFRPAPTVDQYSDMRPRAGSVSTDNPDFEGKRIGLDFQAEIPDMRPAGAEMEEDGGAILVWSPEYLSQEEKGDTGLAEEKMKEAGEGTEEADEEDKEGEKRVPTLAEFDYYSTELERALTARFLEKRPEVVVAWHEAEAAARTSTSTAIHNAASPPCRSSPPLGLSVEVSWDEEEQAAFAEGIRVFRKNFAEVARQYLPSKTVKDVIAYYYRRWKRSANYCAWKKDKLLNRRVKKMINRELVEGTVSSYRVLYDGTEYFRIDYDNGKLEELFRYELDLHLLKPTSPLGPYTHDDEEAHPLPGVSSNTTTPSCATEDDEGTVGEDELRRRETGGGMAGVDDDDDESVTSCF